VHAKFEDRSFTRLRNIERVPKFRNWSTCPRRRPISGQFVVRGQELPTAYVMPNLKIVAFSVCEILRGFQNFEIGSSTPGDAHLGANLWSMGKNCPRPMCVPNLKIVALPVCKILRGSQNFEIGAPAPGIAQFRANLWSGARTAHGLCAYQIWRA